jgi:hypothetical protein
MGSKCKRLIDLIVINEMTEFIKKQDIGFEHVALQNIANVISCAIFSSTVGFLKHLKRD